MDDKYKSIIEFLIQEEEELATLRPPPTLSITEEILEFINQSRVREGLTAMVRTVYLTHLYLNLTEQ